MGLVPACIDRLPWSKFHTRLVIALGVAWVRAKTLFVTYPKRATRPGSPAILTTAPGRG